MNRCTPRIILLIIFNKLSTILNPSCNDRIRGAVDRRAARMRSRRNHRRLRPSSPATSTYAELQRLTLAKKLRLRVVNPDGEELLCQSSMVTGSHIRRYRDDAKRCTARFNLIYIRELPQPQRHPSCGHRVIRGFCADALNVDMRLMSAGQSGPFPVRTQCSRRLARYAQTAIISYRDSGTKIKSKGANNANR
jgi:hypothetical protein